MDKYTVTWTLDGCRSLKHLRTDLQVANFCRKLIDMGASEYAVFPYSAYNHSDEQALIRWWGKPGTYWHNRAQVDSTIFHKMFKPVGSSAKKCDL